MNDFTKEELKKILWHVTTKASIEPGNELVPKIQKMIDGYCKHDEIVTGAYPRSNPPKKCETCGVLYYE